jgi:hypothetical protein
MEERALLMHHRNYNKGWFKVVEFYDSCGELKT